MDEGGYPTEDELKKIQEWELPNQSIIELVDYIESVWHWPDRGFKRRVAHKVASLEKYIELELHTGGWSGNEQIINALESNQMFWLLYWQSSKRGGHYYFEIPLK